MAENFRKAPTLINNKKNNDTFLQIPNNVFDNVCKLCGNSSAELKIMMLFIGTQGGFKPSEKWVEKRTGLVKQSYHRSLNSLIDKGLITREDNKLIINYDVFECNFPVSQHGVDHNYSQHDDDQVNTTFKDSQHENKDSQHGVDSDSKHDVDHNIKEYKSNIKDKSTSLKEKKDSQHDVDYPQGQKEAIELPDDFETWTHNNGYDKKYTKSSIEMLIKCGDSPDEVCKALGIDLIYLPHLKQLQFKKGA